MNGFSRYKKGRHCFQGGGTIGDLVLAVIHVINRWGRNKDRLGDLKQKQQELINKTQELLPPPPPPAAMATATDPQPGHLHRRGNDPPPVWPWKKGTARGIAFHPLYPSVPEAAERNPALGELLALFDAVRGGSAREQALALTLLEERLQP